MRNLKYLGILFVMLSVMACNKIEKERAGVEIRYGIRFDEADQIQEILSSTPWINADLPVVFEIQIPKTEELRSRQVSVWRDLLRSLRRANTPYDLVFLPFPASNPEWTQKDLDHINALIQPAFSTNDSTPPPRGKRRVVLHMQDRPDAESQALLENFCKNIEETTAGIKVAPGFSATREPATEWENLTFLALSYPPLTEPRIQAQEANAGWGAMAAERNIPVYIYRANLIGDQKIKQMKMILRFWPEGTDVEAMVANTIYNEFVFDDKTSYYGWGKDKAISDFVLEYQAR